MITFNVLKYTFKEFFEFMYTGNSFAKGVIWEYWKGQ